MTCPLFGMTKRPTKAAALVRKLVTRLAWHVLVRLAATMRVEDTPIIKPARTIGFRLRDDD